MQTLRQAISDVINDLKSSNLDDRFSFRFLANKLKGKVELFIKQDSVNRAIFNLNEMWKPLPCIKLIDADYNTCSIFYEGCDILKRSKDKVPDAYTGNYGNFIKVLNVNNSLEYTQIKSLQYKDIKNREYRNKKTKYFWIEDGYIYIPDTQVEEVRGLGLFKDETDADKFNGECGDCPRPLDAKIAAPDYILDIAKTQVVTDLANISKRMIIDEKPNLNVNEKTNP